MLHKTALRLSLPTLLAAALLLAAPSPAAAQDIEFSADLGWNFAALRSDYLHSYAPKFTVPPYASSASQTLSVKADSGLALGFLVTLFTSERFGFQIGYMPFKTDVGGGSTNYQISLTYIGGTPPAEITRSWDEEWIRVTGPLHQSAICFNALYRIPAIGVFKVDLSGGLSIIRFDGSLRGVGYTRFSLNADGTLRAEDRIFDLEYSKKGVIGGNIAATLGAFFSRNFAFYAEARYFIAPEQKADINLKAIEVAGLEMIDPAGENIPLSDFKVKVSYLRMAAGVKLSF